MTRRLDELDGKMEAACSENPGTNNVLGSRLM